MNPLSLLSGVWGYVAAAIVAGSLAASGTYYVVHTADELAITKLKLAGSLADTRSVTASLDQLQGFIANMHRADADYGAALDAINNSFVVIKKEFNNATAKPLPADCRPDAGRLRELSAAVAAANAGAIAGK